MTAIILTLVIAMAVSSNVSASPNYGRGVYGRNVYDRVMLHDGLDYHRYKVSSSLDQCTEIFKCDGNFNIVEYTKSVNK